MRRTEFERLLRVRNISAYRLAQMLGYKDKTVVYKWIYGKGEPSAKTMLLLTSILDVSADTILRVFADIEIEERGKEDDKS